MCVRMNVRVSVTVRLSFPISVNGRTCSVCECACECDSACNCVYDHQLPAHNII